METIHYISDFKYISGITGSYKSKKEVVYHHLRYINKSASHTLGNEKLILENCDKYNKRSNSRVALKFVVAIPNNDVDRLFLEKVRDFFAEQTGIKKEYFYLALHERHALQKELQTENKHIHIVATPIDINDKPININPSKLKEIHRNWDKFLESLGYKIKRYEREQQIGKIGPELRKNDELKQAYKDYLNTMRELKDLEHTIKIQKPSPAPEQPRPPEQPKPQPRPPEPKPSEPKPSSSPTHSQFEMKKQQKEQELNMKISVADERDKKTYPTQFLLKEVRTLRELKEIIKTRFYSNIVWQNGYRSSKNAVSISNFIVFDVDGTDRIERVEKILREKNIKALITTTKSHTENSHHFRVIVKVDRELQENELQYYKHFMKVIADDLNINCDKATFDLARMYAPNKNAQFIFIDGKELGIDRYIEEAIKEHDKELMIERARDIKYSNQEQEYWIYVDVSKMIDIDIEQLIEHFESVSKRWKEGSQVYVRTSRSNKYGINKIYNVAYNFYEGRGYGVISYLQEQLNTTHLLNIAKYLQDNSIATDLIFINGEVFTEKLNKCIDNSYSFDDFIDEVKKEFNVKSVFVDFESQSIKIGQFKVKLNENEFDEIYNLYNPKKGPKGPGL